MEISHQDIAALAGGLTNFRPSRYRGEEQAIALDALSPGDRALVASLYATVQELAAVVSDDEGGPDLGALAQLAAREDVGDLSHRLRPLGAGVEDERLAAAIHDIRGGALTALLVQLSRARKPAPREDLARSLATLARDHLKMMRSVVKDLDPAMRARDLALRPHSLKELGQALRAFTAEVNGERVTIELDCDTAADVTESCVECAAVDRAAYNLLNNAVRYTDRAQVGAWLLAQGTDVRVAFANHVSPARREQLAAALADDPNVLFGTFSTTGSGYGLRIVSDLVGRAYGVSSIGALTRDGYVGVKLAGEHVISWFHWPLAGA